MEWHNIKTLILDTLYIRYMCRTTYGHFKPHPHLATIVAVLPTSRRRNRRLYNVKYTIVAVFVANVDTDRALDYRSMADYSAPISMKQ